MTILDDLFENMPDINHAIEALKTQIDELEIESKQREALKAVLDKYSDTLVLMGKQGIKALFEHLEKNNVEQAEDAILIYLPPNKLIEMKEKNDEKLKKIIISRQSRIEMVKEILKSVGKLGIKILLGGLG